MEAMGIFHSDDQKLLCLVFVNGFVQAGVFDLTKSPPQLIEISDKHPIGEDESQLSQKVDECLNTLSAEAQEIDQAVFCLDEGWADAYDVLPAKKQLVEKMFKDLGIEALGFVGWNLAVTDAVKRFSTQPEFVSVILTDGTLEVEYFSANQSQGRAVVNRTQSIGDDLDQLIHKAGPIFSASNSAVYQLVLINTEQNDVITQQLGQSAQSLSWPGLSKSPVIKNMTYQELLTQVMNYTVETWESKNSANNPDKKIQSDLPATSHAPKRKKNMTRSKPKLLLPIFLGLILGIIALYLIARAYFQNQALHIFNVQRSTTPITETITAGLIAEGNQAKYLLESQLIEQEIELTGSKKTSGTATIGEKAKGKIQLVNKTEQPKSFDAGTQLRAGNDLFFVLNEQVTIPATEVKTDESETKETREYGLLDTIVTAADIGEAGNLKKDVELNIGVFDRSSYSAKVVEDFSGGTSQQVAAVAKADVDSLLKELSSEAQAKAEKIWQDSSHDFYVTPIQKTQVVSFQFDPDVDEQAEEVSLVAKFKFSAYSYTSAAVHSLAKTVLQELIPEGMELSNTDPQILTRYDAEADQPTLELELTGLAVPILSTHELAQELVDKSHQEAKAHLMSKKDVKTVTWELKPNLARWFVYQLPTNLNQIELNIIDE